MNSKSIFGALLALSVFALASDSTQAGARVRFRELRADFSALRQLDWRQRSAELRPLVNEADQTVLRNEKGAPYFKGSDLIEAVFGAQYAHSIRDRIPARLSLEDLRYSTRNFASYTSADRIPFSRETVARFRMQESEFRISPSAGSSRPLGIAVQALLPQAHAPAATAIFSALNGSPRTQLELVLCLNGVAREAIAGAHVERAIHAAPDTSAYQIQVVGVLQAFVARMDGAARTNLLSRFPWLQVRQPTTAYQTAFLRIRGANLEVGRIFRDLEVSDGRRAPDPVSFGGVIR